MEGKARRSAVTVVLTVVTGLGISIAAGYAASGKAFNWEVFATAGTAFGTTAVAIVTWRLATATRDLAASTRQDAGASRDMAQLAQAEQEARYTPCVYPFTNQEWLAVDHKVGDRIPFRNGGPGLALNVEGRVYWDGGDTPLVGTTLYGGDHATVMAVARVADWAQAYGYVTYHDLLGREWETHFHFLVPWAGSPVRVELRQYGLRAELPQFAYPLGWEMAAPKLPTYSRGGASGT